MRTVDATPAMALPAAAVVIPGRRLGGEQPDRHLELERMAPPASIIFVVDPSRLTALGAKIDLDKPVSVASSPRKTRSPL